ncbi:MAG: family M48 peptidase [Idiomarinaceae bacterium HL-53]|nr:MAG: family M48 peptidase [Idiomarinaceae bacterium HL-53]CUS48114.1 Zn-dependent protease with chaperone function [Idiomarinaceae bacterium HL-53]
MSGAMNFFEHQEIARKNTRLLVGLFILAVLALVALTGLVVAIFFGGARTVEDVYQQPQWVFNWDILLACAGIVVSAIGLAVAFKWMILRPGGRVVAEQLGGRRLDPDSRDPLERKILNVVEEMAIAANMPVPPVYLLEHEQGINAFAAGYSPKDAVIGLTRGCVEQLNRAQLQGVVAHEIAHILNGDMRMNIRIMALLHGILFISHAGYLLLRTGAFAGSRRNNDKNPLPLLGLALLIIGAIGVLFGNIIKAAVSRQREYLADASAVQFTREPEGIGGALQQIGALQAGSKVEHKKASEASHLFFGQAIGRAFSLFATHPPLEKRIKRILPHWNGEFVANTETSTSSETAAGQNQNQQQPFQQTLMMLAALPEVLREEARSPAHATAFAAALLLSDQTEKRTSQLAYLAANKFSDASLARCQQDYEHLAKLDTSQRLPLIELVMPALKTLTLEEKQKFIELARALPEIGGDTSLYEWCLSQVLVRYLKADLRPNPHVAAVKQHARKDLALSLSILAWYGHTENAQVEQAFQAGAEAFGTNLAPVSADNFNFSALAKALDRMDRWGAKHKERLVSCWLACIEADQQVTELEYKLIYTLANCISEPLPEFSVAVVRK